MIGSQKESWSGCRQYRGRQDDQKNHGVREWGWGRLWRTCIWERNCTKIGKSGVNSCRSEGVSKELELIVCIYRDRNFKFLTQAILRSVWSVWSIGVMNQKDFIRRRNASLWNPWIILIIWCLNTVPDFNAVTHMGLIYVERFFV